ncbi:MAG TPA: HAD domain-containing protein [Actinospica sp.]|nr:HAD domain-containing protein [Actinospica sp.]
MTQGAARGAAQPSGGDRPILFLDVDGPLNPFAARSPLRLRGYQSHRMRPAVWAARFPDAPPLVVRLRPAHGALLLRLPVELVWATTWEAEANDWIGPRIGLPELPFVPWPPAEQRLDTADGRYWKTQAVAAYAAGRAFAWLDDQIGPVDLRWCAEHHPAPTLLRRIDPAIGLRERDLAVVERWAAQLPDPSASSGSSDPGRRTP